MKRFLAGTLLLALYLLAQPAGSDVIILSSRDVIMGHIYGETNNNLLVEVSYGQIEVDIDNVKHVSRSPTIQDTYLDASWRLIQENRLSLAAFCLDRSIRHEPQTREKALALKKQLSGAKLDSLSTEQSVKSSPILKQEAAELRKRGELLIRSGEAAKGAGAVHQRTLASRHMADQLIAEGQRLLAQASQIEEQLREKPKPEPWYARLFKWLRGKTGARAKTESPDTDLKDMVRVLAYIGFGILATLGLGYLIFFRR